MVRWTSEAVDRQPVPTASEGHRTKPRISTGCGIVRNRVSAIALRSPGALRQSVRPASFHVRRGEGVDRNSDRPEVIRQ